MTIEVRPELSQFIEDQVAAGVFPSADAVVEATLIALAEAARADELADEDMAAINEADEETDRGEVITLKEIRAQMATRFPNV